ncbi:MAG: IPT/TIG domain-containing protein [Kofleriaceae bacterium]
MRIVWLFLIVACSKPAPAPEPIKSTPPPAPAPVETGKLKLTGIEPAKGDVDGGTYVRITGNRFIADGARNAKVYFGNRQGTVVRFASDTELIVEAPGGKVGEVVDVLVIFEPGGEMKLPQAFTFIEKPSGPRP